MNPAFRCTEPLWKLQICSCRKPSIYTGFHFRRGFQDGFRSTLSFQLQELPSPLQASNAHKLSEGEEIREYIVGGASYPLLPWLITPFEDNDLSDSMSEFNRILETARSAAVEAFVQLKGDWRILNKVMLRPDKRKLPSIILVCCLLHNIIIDCGDSLRSDVALSAHHDSDYRGHICKQIDPLSRDIREKLARHLLGKRKKAFST